MGRKIVSGFNHKTGRLFINGNEFCITNFTGTEIAEEEETTSSCSAGNNEYEGGNTHVEGSVEADWDISVNPFDNPPALRSGTHIALRHYVHSIPGPNPSGPVFECDHTFINNVRWGVPAKGKVPISFDYKTSGPYSMPTGSDSSSG